MLTLLHYLPNNIVVNYDSSPSAIKKVFKGLCTYLARYSLVKKSIERQVKYIHSSTPPFSMLLEISEYTQCGYYFYIPNQLFIERILEGGDIFLDIGANVGIFSLIASRRFRTVYSFEPTPDTCRYFRRNIDISGVDNVHLFPLALSDKSGEMTLYSNPLNSGGNSLQPFPEEFLRFNSITEPQKWVVEISTLDKIVFDCQMQQLDLIKIDVEGHECNVVVGAKRTIERFKPDLFIEVSSFENFVSICRELPECYKAIDLQSRCMFQPEAVDWNEANVLFTAKSSLM